MRIDFENLLDWSPSECFRPKHLDRKCESGQLRAFEEGLGAEFPLDYVEFILLTNGGVLPRRAFTIADFPGQEFNLRIIYGIGANQILQNPKVTRDSRDWLPKNLFQFGSLEPMREVEDAPSYMVMPIRDDRSIYAVDLVSADLLRLGNDPNAAKGVYKVAESFSDFLMMLK